MIDKILYKLCSEPVKFMLTKMKEEPETGSARYMPLMPKKNSKYYSLVERIALNRAITPIHRAEMAKAIYDILMKPVNDGWITDEEAINQSNISLNQHLNNLVAKNMGKTNPQINTLLKDFDSSVYFKTVHKNSNPMGPLGGMGPL